MIFIVTCIASYVCSGLAAFGAVFFKDVDDFQKIFMQKLAMRMALSPLSYTKVYYMIIIVIMIKLLNIN